MYWNNVSSFYSPGIHAVRHCEMDGLRYNRWPFLWRLEGYFRRRQRGFATSGVLAAGPGVAPSQLSTVTQKTAVFALAAAAAEAGSKLVRKARWGRQGRQDEVRRKSRFAGSAVSSLTSHDFWSGPTLKLPPTGRIFGAQAENRTTSTAL